MIRIITVGYNELALVFKNRNLHKILRQGSHIATSIFGLLDVRTHDITCPRMKDDDLLRYADHPLMARMVERHDVRDDQRLIVWQRDRVAEILGGGSYFFWKHRQDVQLELIDIEGPLFSHPKLKQILASIDSWTHIRKIIVKSHEKALLYADGDYQETLSAGFYAFWTAGVRTEIHKVDMRNRQAIVQLDDSFSIDGIPISIKIGLSYKAVEPRACFEMFENLSSELERKAASTARTMIGKLPAKEILENATHVINSMLSSLIGLRLGTAIEIVDAQIIHLDTETEFRKNLASEAIEIQRAKGDAVKNDSELARLKGLESVSGFGAKIKVAEITSNALGKANSLHIGGKALNAILSSLTEKDKTG